jgi:sterol desaturase/sphingolipid hydroxylase (fatty acid hydroxylase superfamily)
VEILWQFHKVHHYSEEMNPMVAVRVHDLDETLQIQCLFLGGMLFVGTLFPITAETSYTESAYWMVGLYQVFLRVSSRFAHSHIPFSLGPVLDRVINTAVIHQMHHSREIFDTNFGQSLSIWDSVFGTFYRPKPDEVVRFGVPEAREDEYRSLIHAQVQPYIEVGRILRRKLRRRMAAVGVPETERSTST